MINGGYQIIDFSGITVFDGTQSIVGAFESIKACNKPILASNFAGKTSFFTCDVVPTDTTKAILTLVTYDSGSLVPIGIVVNADDTVVILS